MVSEAAPAFAAPDSSGLEIDFGAPGPQSRVTVAFRPLLVIPHVLVLDVLIIVSNLLLVAGWFAALVLGRLPRWIAAFEIGLIAYAVRVYAYWYMLAREFPAFSLSKGDYPVTVALSASRLSRLKVFFRLLLAIPASVVTAVAGTGLVVLGPFIWLITLVRGRTPRPIFGAAAAVIRYQARLQAYMSLVTDAYPSGLFGDREWVWDSEEPSPELRMRLSGGARSLLRLMLVLGVVVPVVTVVVIHESRPGRNPAVAAAELRLDNAEVAAVRSCKLSCEEAHEHALGEAYFRFASSISRISFPRPQRVAVSVVIHDARRVGQLMLAASKSKDGGRAEGIDPTDPADSPLPSAFDDEVASVLGPFPA